MHLYNCNNVLKILPHLLANFYMYIVNSEDSLIIKHFINSSTKLYLKTELVRQQF